MAGLAGECYFRLVQPASFWIQGQKIILPIRRRYEFHHSQLRGTDADIIHTTNSLGFREMSQPPGFFALFNSRHRRRNTTECFYLSDGKTWTDRLGRSLKGSFHHLWVNNAGLDGHSTFGHLILTRDYLRYLQPKVVLFLVGVNDVGRQ